MQRERTRSGTVPLERQGDLALVGDECRFSACPRPPEIGEQCSVSRWPATSSDPGRNIGTRCERMSWLRDDGYR
ncbi:MAG: hypothetical protein RI885_676 [Actinomycetota bacterium]